jgi:hypothetical protein
MVFRFLLLVLLGYVLWKIVQILFRVVGNLSKKKYVREERKQGAGNSLQGDYGEIQDAEFHDIKPDQNTKKNDTASE